MFDYMNRINRVREIINKNECDAFLSFCPIDNRYLSGFTGSSSAIIITANHTLLFTDFRYLEQSGQEVSDYQIVIVKGELEKEVANALSSHNVKKVAIHPAKMNLLLMDTLKKQFSGEFISVFYELSMLRIIKDEKEINLIKEACQITEKCVYNAVKNIKEGMTEKELSLRIDYEFRLSGADGSAFDTIVLFGNRSSLPHGKPSDRTLNIGDIVLIDCGCVYKGYCSDLTRTFIFGAIPSTWFMDIYTIVLNAQNKALSMLKPNVLAKDVDSVARNIITGMGYGEYFGHGLGHGVGLEIHEPPRLNRESETILEEGFVVTVEPGIYVPNRGGVRIEDTVVITKNGCERLTVSDKELFVIPV